MADYRNHSRKMWDNSFIQELDSDGFRLWIYLTCNLHDSCSGLYELPARYIPFETGLPAEKCKELLAEFEQAGKIRYQDGVMWVKSMRRHNTNSGYKMIVCANGDVVRIKSCPVKSEYVAWLKENNPEAYALYLEKAVPEKTKEVDSDQILILFQTFWDECEKRGMALTNRAKCVSLWKKLALKGKLPAPGEVLTMQKTYTSAYSFLEMIPGSQDTTADQKEDGDPFTGE